MSFVLGALKWLRSNPLIAIIAVLVIAVSVQTARLHAERGARVDAELAADSLEASLDTTRQIHVAEINAFQRRIIQTVLRADSLDEALQQESTVRARLEARIASLEVEDTSEVTEDSAGVRFASTEGYQEPFTYSASVVVPPPPESATWAFSVGLDPLVLRPRVGCGDASEGRLVRPATLTVQAPEWADVRLSELEQAPEVCNPALFGDAADTGFWDRISVGLIGLASLKTGYYFAGAEACYDGWCVYGGYGEAGEDFGIIKTFFWSPF